MFKISWKVFAAAGVALIVVGAGVLAASILSESSHSPYEKVVLATQGNTIVGKELFNANCSACHGTEATGWVGPNLHDVAERKSDVEIIRQVTSGQTPPMPKFELDEKQMANLLSYLKSI